TQAGTLPKEEDTRLINGDTHPVRTSREHTHATVYNMRLFRGAMRRANQTRHSTGAHYQRDKETP
ncbi:hypothetical protein, partial [Burkholderia stabilis]